MCISLLLQDKASTMDLQLSRMQLLIDPLWQGIGKSVDTPYVAEESTLQVCMNVCKNVIVLRIYL